MGLYVLLEKIDETEHTVTYKYEYPSLIVNEDDYGIVEFDHFNETYKIKKEHCSDKNHAVLERAIYAILREWKKGSFPDRTDWAS